MLSIPNSPHARAAMASVRRASVAKIARHRPIGKQLERGVRHRHQRKIAALADIKPAGAVLELTLVVDEAGKVLRAVARNPVVLDRPPGLSARRDVQKAETVRP